jgi:hypothetical protein
MKAIRMFAFAPTLAVALLLPATALAGGNFGVKTPDMTESKAGEWHIKVRIDLARSPALMHVPMRFTFSKIAVDERSIMSKGAEPVHTRQVLDPAPKQIVSMDVDFADPAGKVFKSTYFEFDLERKSGYFEAGEYQVSLAGPDGDVGGSQKVVLHGDNPPVYRGAMDFGGSDKPTKKKGVKIESVDNGTGDDKKKNGGDDDTPAAAPVAGEVAASGTAPDMIPKGSYNKTEEEEAVQGHPKGCGCVAAGVNGSGLGGAGALGLAVLGLGVVATRRRR